MNLNYMTSSRRMAALFLTLGLSLLISACNFLKSAEQLKADVNSAMEMRNYSVAAQIAQEWVKKVPDQYEPYFFLAQAQAQAGDRNASLVALEQAIRNGLKDDAQIETNTNLDSVKSMVAYGDLMKTHFPGRTTEPKQALQDTEDVSITEKNGKQVLRAGDVVIEVPVLK